MLRSIKCCGGREKTELGENFGKNPVGMHIEQATIVYV